MWGRGGKGIAEGHGSWRSQGIKCIHSLIGEVMWVHVEGQEYCGQWRGVTGQRWRWGSMDGPVGQD